MGYYLFINFFVTVVTKTSGVGLAGATRKYMSEFLALDRPGTARAVYHLAYKFQLLGSALIAGLGVGAVLLFGDAAYKLISCILIVSIVPGIMSWVPAEANNAFEDASKNTLSAFGYLVSYGLVIVLTVWLHWDLVGVASATLVGRTVEVLMRTAPLHRRLAAMPLDVLDAELVGRIRRFCLQAIGIQLLMTVVWDRSEMVFLKAFSTLEQIAFYSISFSLANNLLSVPRTFGSATGMTMMVEASRDPKRVNALMRNSVRLSTVLGAAGASGCDGGRGTRDAAGVWGEVCGGDPGDDDCGIAGGPACGGGVAERAAEGGGPAAVDLSLAGDYGRREHCAGRGADPALWRGGRGVGEWAGTDVWDRGALAGGAAELCLPLPDADGGAVSVRGGGNGCCCGGDRPAGAGTAGTGAGGGGGDPAVYGAGACVSRAGGFGPWAADADWEEAAGGGGAGIYTVDCVCYAGGGGGGWVVERAKSKGRSRFPSGLTNKKDKNKDTSQSNHRPFGFAEDDSVVGGPTAGR